jgi:hypothetical protein
LAKCVLLLGSVVGAILAVKVNRKTSLVLGVLGQSIFGWLWAIAWHWDMDDLVIWRAILVTGVAGYAFCYAAGKEATGIIWLCESLSASGLAICIAIDWLITGIVSYFVYLTLGNRSIPPLYALHDILFVGNTLTVCGCAL